MTINHIDQLTQWWESAEETSAVNIGDLVIQDRRGLEGGFDISPARRNALPVDGVPRRILSRAPKPKPAWHDAFAVIAHIGGNELPRVLVRDNDGAFVDGVTGHAYAADRLRDVTPLIEAKVTDEMVIRARGSLRRATGYDYAYATVQDALTAALGLETE